MIVVLDVDKPSEIEVLDLGTVEENLEALNFRKERDSVDNALEAVAID